MQTLNFEVYSFNELDAQAQVQAIKDCMRKGHCIDWMEAIELIHTDRFRFYKNGCFFDALGLKGND